MTMYVQNMKAIIVRRIFLFERMSVCLMSIIWRRIILKTGYSRKMSEINFLMFHFMYVFQEII